VSHLVTYRAVLPIGRHTIARLCTLLSAKCARRGAREGKRALDCYDQAILVLRWFYDGTRVARLARDNQIGPATSQLPPVAHRGDHRGRTHAAPRRVPAHHMINEKPAE
jgi:hypothetical protein